MPTVEERAAADRPVRPRLTGAALRRATVDLTRSAARRVASAARAAPAEAAAWIDAGRSAIRTRPRRVTSIVFAAAAISAVVPLGLRSSTGGGTTATIAKFVPLAAAAAPSPAPSLFSGLDLRSLAIDDDGAVTTLSGGRIARLTVDPRLQLEVTRLLAKHKLPQAAVVVLEPSTGRILAYASRDQSAPTRDLNTEAFAPSASVFKIVTGAALVQIAGIGPDFKMCYSGGEQKILPSDLKDDPKRDHYCATLAQAMGRSINTIFARLAHRKLNGADLHAIATQLGYGAPLPFEIPVAPSKIDLPSDGLGFARTAAGFWNTTLSPLHGAVLAGTIANGGVAMRPFVVSEIVDGSKVVWKAPAPTALRKAIDPATAAAVERMMAETVSQGTSYKAFHDAKGRSFLPGIDVAGKTGTLNQPQPLKLFTWFVGYAPIKAPKVAIATLVVNDPVWKVKANVLSREVLQAYFAAQGATGVNAPKLDP